MSFFSKAASFASKAAEVAVSTAKTGVEASKKAYRDLNAYPTTVTCQTENCKTVISVPAALWTWTCEAGHVNADGDKCVQCQATRPAGPNPVVQCPACQQNVEVPRSVAAGYAKTAATGVKTAATATADFTKKTYADLSARPETVPCSNGECTTVLAVPPNLWDWTCAEGHPNFAGAKVCSQCGGAKPKQDDPVLACPVCQAHTEIPSTVALLRAKIAASTAKKAAIDTADATKKQYKHWKSSPEQFNCANCNEKLMVPEPAVWLCETAGCGAQNNPDLTHCEACKQKWKPKVMCGVCNKVTDIPESNFLNSVRSTKLSTQQAYSNAKQTASFVSEHKEEIKAAGQFAKDNPELAKAAVDVAKASQ